MNEFDEEVMRLQEQEPLRKTSTERDWHKEYQDYREVAETEIGIARLRLEFGDIRGATEALDRFCSKTDELDIKTIQATRKSR